MDGRLDTIQLYPLSLSKLFDGYFSGSTYRTTKCVPTDECTEFTADYDNEWAQSFEYIIRVNGEETEEHRLLEQKNHQTSMRTILGGKNCPKEELSSGAVAGIVIGTLSAVGLVVYIGYRLHNRDNVTNAFEESNNEDDGTGASDGESYEEVAKGVIHTVGSEDV